jgi:hypothetical protein
LNTRTSALTYYIQTAIDDADEGDTISVWSGTYYENIEINKEIILIGDGTSTIITVDVSDSGLGSPPIVNSSREGINITADNVELRDLIISNFSIGIKIFGADEVYLSNIQIFDVDSDGIQVSGSEYAEIIGLYIESSSDGSGISVISGSDNFVMSDTVIIGFENGIFVNSYGASLENVTSSFNDNYGCYVVGTNIEISDSTFTENGINGIKLNALTSGILDNNLIFDNGNAEVRIISVVNIEMKDNSISDPSDGYGIHVTTSSGLDIHDNILNLTIWLDDSDFNTIRNNIFSSINGGSITYDNAAIVVAGSNNTLSDNDIDDVGIAFAFLPGNHNYNTIENNTLGLAGYDIEYYTTGQNNTFINTDIGIVDISEDSYFEIIQFIDIEMLTLTGPADGVELEILEGDNSIYSTEMYGGSDAKTDTFGTLDRLFIISKIYDGVWVPEYVDTFITYYYDGAEYNKELDISILQENSHLERIWVNLRAISVIAEVNGIGDNLQTGVEEAVKGADRVLVDQYTIAYWPFDEGTENNVIDSTGNYTGTILPIGIWNDGRPDSIADTSVEFDGTFTNIDTDLTMDNVEFTVEIWFKTEGLQTMTLISDKDNPNEWGYNLYIDNFVQFDFTIDGGQRVGVELETSVIDGEWHFVTVVRGEDYVRIWLDDEYREKSWSGEIDFTGSNIGIGQTPLGGNLFSGLIDDLRFSSITRHEEDFMIGGGIVEFISESSDIDGNISEHRWSSSLDGDLGEGRILYYPVEYLTEGSHTIYLSIVDDNGTFSDTVSSVLVVMQRPDSQILSLKINGNSEAWGWQVELDNGDLVEFTGGTGSEQFISAYLWVSSIDGVLYENGQDGTSSFSTTLLSNGTHTISFSLRGGNGLWSTEKTFDLEVNGRPEISENAVISETELTRFRSAMVKVKIIDDTTLGEELDYVVSYRVKGTEEWFEEYIHDVTFNGETEELEFIFTPDGAAPVGNYEFSIEVVDELGGVSDPYVLSQSIAVENNDPVIQSSNLDVEEGEEPKTVTAGEVFDLGIDSSDEDGIVSTVIWYADIDGDGEPEEIGTGANFTFENNNLPIGDNLIIVRVLDNEGSYVEQTFTVVVIAQPIEESLVAMALEDFSNNLPLIASVGIGFIMIVGTIALRRNRNTDPVVEGLVVDDGTDSILASRAPIEVEEWDIPTDAQGNALIIGEYMAKRRESYISHPNNDEVVDYLHNNRERFAISSYFDVPGDPTVVVTDWALPENLRGNVHLDSFRQQIIERITDSSPDKNFVIIGEPGVGKTVMLFEVFDRLMNKAPVGILSTDTIAKAHEMFGVRVFYDDIPENQKLVEALTENDVKGVIVSSREADWKALPTEMQAKFDRLTVPLFSELDMKTMIQKMMTFQSIGFNEDSVKILAEYAEGSPIYVWSMVREMMHRGVKTLTREYIKENSVKGMINYVAQLLQRLLKDGEEYRKGGLHALASLIFLSDHMEERYCNDYFFDAYVEVLSKYTEEKLDDKMNPKTLNLVLAYLPINDSVIRFPHDTWPDVLQGWGDMNPFSTELRMINRAFADSGIFQDLKKEVVSDVWNSTYERYKRTPSRQKNSFLALADTLFQNFTIDELKESGVDIDIVRQVASTYSHIPQAAKLISKIQAVLPQTVTRIINMQDLGTDGSHAPYKIQEMYLIYNDGRMLSSLMDKEAKVDSDIMSSMLTAINDFVKDSFQTTGNLGSIDYGENQIILERGEHIILASVVYGEANRDLRSRMSRALTKIEDEFGSKLKSWDGDVDSLSGTVTHLQPIMDISKPVTKSMIDELQALKSVNLRSSWTQVAGFFEVNLLLNNYSKKAIKGAKLTLEYGSDFLKLVKTEPNYKYKVNEVDVKKIPANAEMSVTLYFEPLKSVQASLNVHLDYDSKGGNASGVSSAVFERVDLYKEGVKLNLDDINNAAKAEVVAIPQTDTAEVVEAVAEVAEVVEAVAEVAEVVEAVAEVAEVVEAVAEVAAVTSDVEVLDAVVEEADSFDSGEAEVVEAEVVAEVIEEPEVPAMDPGDSGVDDILSKLSELDDPENAPKKKEKKSEEDEDKSGMDDLLGKLDEL